MNMKYHVITGDQSIERFFAAKEEVGSGFPAFMNHGEIVNRYWHYLPDYWPAYQFALIENRSGRAVAFGNSVPLYYEGEMNDLPDGGLDWAVETAAKQWERGKKPNIACAFQIVIPPAGRGKKLSYQVVTAMCDNARRLGAQALIAPVRPNRRENNLDMSFDDYVALERDDGLPFDDWLRVHVRLGGQMKNICHRSFVVRGTIDEWREWTGVTLTRDGENYVPGGLVPVKVDVSKQVAVYSEPNVWMFHPL